MFSVLLFYLRSTGSTDAGKEVGAENANCEDCHGEGDDEVNKGRENLANLEIDASDRHLELSDTLAGCCSGGQERSDDALRDGGEELGHNSAEVDGGGDDDNIQGRPAFVVSRYFLNTSFLPSSLANSAVIASTFTIRRARIPRLLRTSSRRGSIS